MSTKVVISPQIILKVVMYRELYQAYMILRSHLLPERSSVIPAYQISGRLKFAPPATALAALSLPPSLPTRLPPSLHRRCHCLYAIVVSLLCHCCAIAVPLLCHCCAIAVPLLCRCCAVAAPLLSSAALLRTIAARSLPT